jgi:hypothetical protein
MKIHWSVWYLLIKDLIAVVILYYWDGENAALWWVALNGFIYGIVALNHALVPWHIAPIIAPNFS